MFAQFELPRCQLCTRDAVVKLFGKFSGEDREFVVCRGCRDELCRIRRTWHFAPVLEFHDDCLTDDEWQALEDQGVFVGRLGPRQDEFDPEFDLGIQNGRQP